ncbi:hypothetical protein [Shewanella fidelis]|uniref:Uncharacterized protein n=1 Tax=Shewanella fidelis TaxID=173509 RepID=A0ABU4H9G7_9GAMM|nr:hypothetical protein [Shewanella fidelis]MDW4823245.1 hypothetical protein [Shewanella fidelis]
MTKHSNSSPILEVRCSGLAGRTKILAFSGCMYHGIVANYVDTYSEMTY